MLFEFATAARIRFGAGAARELATASQTMGSRALIVTGATPRLPGLEGVRLAVHGEPTIELVRHGAALAREAGCDHVIACGGGSALDAGKAIAALMTNSGDVMDYLEVIGAGRPLERNAAPVIAAPTTAGTGSEVTRNAVLASPEDRVKASLRSPSMLPRLALVDPELMLDLPPALTAATGMDALTQLIEPFVSARANPVTDALCREGIRLAVRSLRMVYENGADLAARADMALAALFGGMALANAGLGAVHGFAAPVGGMFPAPHGAVCAALLPHVTRANIEALRSRASDSPALERYGEVARILTGDAIAAAEDCVPWLEDLREELKIPPLSSYGIGAGDADVICERASQASSMKGNPVKLCGPELRQALLAALD